ncbi:MAG: flavin reductase family protein [Streptosporangiaceae bacterium]
MTEPVAAGGPGIRGLRELIMPVVVAASEGRATTCATSTTSYVSLSPAVLSVALRPDSRTAQMIGRTGRFSVSLLLADQVDVAQRAGRRGTATGKMGDVGIEPEPAADGSGPPGAARAAAVLWCAVTGVTPAGDHLVIFGQVEESRVAATSTPLLLRHQRRYLASGEPLSGYAPEGYPI